MKTKHTTWASVPSQRVAHRPDISALTVNILKDLCPPSGNYQRGTQSLEVGAPFLFHKEPSLCYYWSCCFFQRQKTFIILLSLTRLSTAALPGEAKERIVKPSRFNLSGLARVQPVKFPRRGIVNATLSLNFEKPKKERRQKSPPKAYICFELTLTVFNKSSLKKHYGAYREWMEVRSESASRVSVFYTSLCRKDGDQDVISLAFSASSRNKQ